MKQNMSPAAPSLLTGIIEDFACSTDFGSVLVDIRGIENSNLYNFSPFCNLMRSSPEFRHLCQKCDLYGGLEAYKTGQPSIYRCHAGLTDISLPIVQSNQLSGFLLFGQVQVTDEENSNYTSIQTINTDWMNSPNLRQARNKVKLVSSKQVESAASILREISQFHTRDVNPRDQIKFNVKSKKPSNQQEKVSNNEEIRKALTYIQKNLSRPITLEEVANHVYLSQYYFSKLFKKEMNINFVTYVNQKRIEEAKKLLVESSLSIETISRNLGFSQPSYFIKTFRSMTSSTPANYRRDHSA
ncbi:PocR ligand-binding domain-containing protein [Vagococcus carniphilus]|uniref:PocR ligand-binding domain-containing protein n=1 Tax=Vagococcus carniphilus TaxID=218144 RepID=A0AAW8U7S1_9ENTE|nr:PocR ligand-binding domain-containing protein [Vagococcus carniphilus]MDT2815422.1 PocR ligand-binding domain-containing protein [Vagococcus carniphilus]MDT2830732.1 PocR ligand-binding domain-containing protein [Vagococcus carniphilus]MDT2833035.1 PocR ligand-binding domain-containing protein [Vagococcus carniphilus]MDT2839496.1 PocR ligand-binding domain-containing protein [Vagococcus carniphilus]MDT2848485.1 PocR ligand-binding domain-containing protein [Vagococcus carniphilus]